QGGDDSDGEEDQGQSKHDRLPPSVGRWSSGQGAGGDLTCRLLTTRTTPLTLPASAAASALTFALGTSPASVTTPLVTLMSTLVMLEKRPAVSFALMDAWMLASSICVPGLCVVVHAAPAKRPASATAARSRGMCRVMRSLLPQSGGRFPAGVPARPFAPS